MLCKPILTILFVLGTALNAQLPDLRAGEALVVISQSGEASSYGNADIASPMGSLAKILWLRLEAEEWETFALAIRCRGELNGIRCTTAKGHGRVDLAKSFKDDCNVAFSVWTNLSLEKWKKDYGESGARLRMNEIFNPFLGDRLPKNPPLPHIFGPEWYSSGQMLQASTSMLAKWLSMPDQEMLLRVCRNYMLGFTHFITGTDKWWVKEFEAPVLQVPGREDGQKQFWVVGADSKKTAILRMPPGMSQKDAQARFRDLMNIKK